MRRKVIRITVLRPCPPIEKFFNDQKANFITDIHKNFGSRIVRNTDRIHAHILHNAQLAVNRVMVRRRAQGSLVMMHAYAVNLYIFPIQLKALIVNKFVPFKAKFRVICVKRFISVKDLCPDIIQIRSIRRPQFRSVHFDIHSYVFHSPCRYFHGSGLLRLCFCTSFFIYGIPYSDIRLSAAVILYIHSNIHGTVASITFFKFRCSNKRPVFRYMYRIRHNQSHITVDAAP